MTPRLSLFSLLLVFGLAACGSSNAPQISTPQPTSPVVTQSNTPSALKTASPSAEQAACSIVGGETTLRILAASWAIVVAAKGEADEPRYVIEFADSAKDFFDDVDDEDGCDGSQLAVDAAALNYQATLLATPFKVQPPSSPEETQYNAVAGAGNQLLETAEIDGAKFLKANCHGHVDDTEQCTALED